MSVFKEIIKGMADGAEALQANFAKLAKAIVSIDDTTGAIELGDVTVNNLAVNGMPLNTVKSASFQMWSSSTTTAYRVGNVVTLINNKQDSGTIADNTVSTQTVPVGYRPAETMFFPAVYGASIKGEIQINNSGTFTARGAITGAYRATMTYITDDTWPN